MRTPEKLKARIKELEEENTRLHRQIEVSSNMSLKQLQTLEKLLEQFLNQSNIEVTKDSSVEELIGFIQECVKSW